MTPATPRALIYMTARNCERYLRAAIESVAWQTHAALHVLFIDDCSDDGTAGTARALLATHLPDRHTFVRNPEPWGKARNAHVHLREALPRGDFVAILDADDQLIRATILAEMASEYANGHDVVWTSFETEDGHAGGSRPLDPLQPPRPQGWRTSHFFSFRAELFANVPEDYLCDDSGHWFPAACDRAIALPILDQTRRYKFLPVSALRYTASNPNSHHNRDPKSAHFSSRQQSACAEQVAAKPPLPCTRWALGERAGGDEALFALREQLRADLQVLGAKVDALVNAAAASAAATPAPPRIAPAVSPAVQLSIPAPVSVSPAARAQSCPDDVWSQVAAATLAQRCPALLDLMMDGQASPLPLRDAWRWWNWLQASGRPPAVLEVGAGPLAAPLQAMVHALGGRFLSVSGDRPRALALWARLQAAHLSADVLHAPLVPASLGDHAGQVPDLSSLPAGASGFDVLLTSTACAGRTPADALLALPMAVARLDPAGFRVCVWAPEDAPLRARLANAWGGLAPDLVFINNAFDGQALCVHPA